MLRLAGEASLSHMRLAKATARVLLGGPGCPAVEITVCLPPYAEASLIRSIPRIIQATALALLAAGTAALAVALLPLLWFVFAGALCAVLAVGGAVLARRGATRTKNEEATQAHAARLAELNRKSDSLKARACAVEQAQMEVLEGFRREHGL